MVLNHISTSNFFLWYVHTYKLFFLRSIAEFLQKFTWIVLSVHKLNKLGKFWISCQVMADMKKVYDDIIIINLYELFSGWLCHGLNMGRITGFYILGDFLVLIFHYLKCEELWITRYKQEFFWLKNKILHLLNLCLSWTRK